MSELDDDSGSRDPALEELASLWRTLVPPDPTAAVDAPDAATRALLVRLRAAWAAAAPASSALPWPLRWRIARRRLMPPVAAAAALLVVAGLLLTPRPRAPDVSRGDRVVHLPTTPPAASAVPAACETPARDSIPIVSLDAARMELRRGPVRLILVTPPPVMSLARHVPKDAEPASAKEPK